MSNSVSASSGVGLNFGRIAGRVLVLGTLALFVLYFLAPLFVMITTSLKSMPEIRAGNIISLPRDPSFEAWRVAWQEACVGVECPGIRGFYKNTFLMVIPAVTVSTLLGAINGFALTKYRFTGHRLVFGLFMFGCFIPHQAIILPMARALGMMDLSGSLWGLALVHTVYGIPFTTMFFRNYYISIPQELVKAARVDGAGFFRIFWSIMLPISAPIIIVSVIWQFTNIWNDFLFGASFTYGANAPIMVALNNIVNTSTGERPYNVHMAAAIMAALPTLVIYVLAGRYFVRGLVAGSVKG
ncbi:carbohydrate ABC transporter permease [Nitratireductor sp. ZSWI3]|uniref:carbohydrate ABC transporter permease n=1 Tax=Nitratireductor sp. ZSWI3 TaxID=2966359 RepID=UPI0021504215|nr:carbohydrate ABC transporter permease [Nitratireductor sp. ZSWI3]MCR4265828.1 carbohydrate ABC transporter permease [Nitratireductor sp. ZSWI3]